MPGCQTREENAADLARDQARQLLIDMCANDLSITLFNESKFRFELCRDGFKGFSQMGDAELVQAASDAGLDDSSWNEERNEQVRAAMKMLCPVRD